MLPYFFRDIPKNNLDIRNNYFRYQKTIFSDIQNTPVSGYHKILLRISEKLFFLISRIMYPFTGILDPKYLFLISKIILSDIQKKRLFRISQIVAHLKLEILKIKRSRAYITL